MKIKFSSPKVPANGALVVLVGEKGSLGDFGKQADKAAGGQLVAAIKATGFKGKLNDRLDIPAPGKSGLSRIVVYGVGDTAKLDQYHSELVGGAIAGYLMGLNVKAAAIAAELAESGPLDEPAFAAALGSGARLRDYKFDKYKRKKNATKDDKAELSQLTLLTGKATAAGRAFARFDAIADGVHLARDLVNEPANHLYPEEFARRAQELSKLGVKVEVLTPKQMEKLGMGALLGVAQGSSREARMAIMQWNGGRKGDKPVCFVGKGVTFDTGGISIKPAAGMEDMIGDMGGAACVTGLMAALAGRKAKVNAVGVIGLVENMPDGNAQRPGDIVTSMSGQTIAVLNTDAEGRLVLADALWYAQDRFKPKFMVDLATLTGAILVALGKEHAGLFSNDDELAGRLSQAGSETGEKVWRLPLAPEYDKLIDSDVADMKNIGGRNAGSITAAQFLKRFVNDVPWAHLDVAGTAMASPKSAINHSWGSGWGVRLLNQLVADHYE